MAIQEISEIIDNLVHKSEQCIDEGNNWVRYSDFLEIANKLLAINEKLEKSPNNDEYCSR